MCKNVKTTTIQVEDIIIKINGAGCEFDSLATGPELIAVEFTYYAGQTPVLTGPWENADPGAPPEIEIVKITAICQMLFMSGDGAVRTTLPADHDITALFTPAQIEAFEDQLLTRVQKGEIE